MFIGLMPVGQLALGALGTLLGIHAALAIGGPSRSPSACMRRCASRCFASGARPRIVADRDRARGDRSRRRHPARRDDDVQVSEAAVWAASLTCAQGWMRLPLVCFA